MITSLQAFKGGNPTLLDTSSLQYAPWQAYLMLTTPNPEVAPSAYRSSGWGQESPNTFIEYDGKLWFFDAVIRAEHMQAQRITQHPVQTGANISDHSYSMPAALTLEIGMSDVMDSFAVGQWGTDQSEPTKSVQVYQTLVQWKNLGEPLSITTRLGTYKNMVIATISASDDIKTLYGLKAIVTFQQIFTATVTVEKTSARPAVTEENKLGNKEVVPLTGSVIQNYHIPGWDEATQFFNSIVN